MVAYNNTFAAFDLTTLATTAVMVSSVAIGLLGLLKSAGDREQLSGG